MERIDEAEPYLRQALEGFQKWYGVEHPDTFDAMSSVADLYVQQAKFPEAEAQSLEAYEGRVKLFRPAHPHITKSIEQLITIYDAWHAAEPGKGHDAKAAEWRAKLTAVEADNAD